MTGHIPEDLFSQWLDGELGPEQDAQVQDHLKCCEACRTVESEMSEADRMFRLEKMIEPPPFLWTRIAAQLEAESRREARRPFGLDRAFAWMRTRPQPVWLRAALWAPAAVLLAVLGTTVTLIEHRAAMRAQMAALAEIDRAHVALLASSTKNHNPFHVATAADAGLNPFAQVDSRDQSNPFRTALDRP